MSNTEALRAAAQAVLDRWDSPQWEWIKHCPTADLMHALRTALAQPAASGEPAGSAYMLAGPAHAMKTVASGEPVATVTECEACFTPDACRLRGKCDHYAAEKLRIAAPTARPAPVAPQEPVAWHCPNDPDSATAFFWRATKNGSCPNCSKKLVPVYVGTPPAEPAPRVAQPLTQAQLRRLYNNSPEFHCDVTSRYGFYRIVMLAERAHGITAHPKA